MKWTSEAASSSSFAHVISVRAAPWPLSRSATGSYAASRIERASPPWPSSRRSDARLEAQRQRLVGIGHPWRGLRVQRERRLELARARFELGQSHERLGIAGACCLDRAFQVGPRLVHGARVHQELAQPALDLASSLVVAPRQLEQPFVRGARFLETTALLGDARQRIQSAQVVGRQLENAPVASVGVGLVAGHEPQVPCPGVTARLPEHVPPRLLDARQPVEGANRCLRVAEPRVCLAKKLPRAGLVGP